jgi:hypothetical protein
VNTATVQPWTPPVELPEAPPPDDPVAFLEWLIDKGEGVYLTTLRAVWPSRSTNAQIGGYVPKEARP